MAWGGGGQQEEMGGMGQVSHFLGPGRGRGATHATSSGPHLAISLFISSSLRRNWPLPSPPPPPLEASWPLLLPPAAAATDVDCSSCSRYCLRSSAEVLPSKNPPSQVHAQGRQRRPQGLSHAVSPTLAQVC